MSQEPSTPGGVGLTALGVAALRAAENARPDALFTDPWAARFVAAADLPFEFPPGRDRPEEFAAVWGRLAAYLVIRTRFFDRYLLDAAAAGIRQVVVLAAGLDTRALRLPWPDGLRFWELDLPEMVGFKERVLAEGGAAAACDRTVLAADLREDWPALLREAGHDPALPTAWMAEGLLMYLTEADNDRLLDRIGALSAPGSRLAVSAGNRAIRDSPLAHTSLEALGDAAIDLRSLWRSGFDVPPVDWLADHGWRAAVHDLDELGDAYGRPLPAASAAEEALGTEWLLSADRQNACPMA